MPRLFFKKMNESIAQCSRLSLISLVFMVELIDLFTAYLNFLFRPVFFLKYEINPWIKAAFYFGQWEKLFVPWTVLVASLIICFIVLTNIKRGKYFNFFLTLIIILLIGTALTNVCGMIFNSYQHGSLIFALIVAFSALLLALITVEQVEQFPGIADDKFLKKTRSLIDQYDFLKQKNDWRNLKWGKDKK